MHLYAVTPIHVGPDELARRRARYDLLAPAGVTVQLDDLGPEAPTALETTADLRASEDLVEKALAAAPERADAVFPDCVLDPAVPPPGRFVPGPRVLGLTRLAVGNAVLAGLRVGAVARNATIAEELQATIDRYGWSEMFTGVEVLDLAVTDIDDAQRWAAAVRPALVAAAEAGADVVLNGCSAVEVGAPEPGLPLLLDPVRSALVSTNGAYNPT